MNAPATFAWTKPIVSPARWRRLDCFGLDVRIKQPHGRFEMRQIGAMLIHLMLKTFDRVRDFQSLISMPRASLRSVLTVIAESAALTWRVSKRTVSKPACANPA